MYTPMEDFALEIRDNMQDSKTLSSFVDDNSGDLSLKPSFDPRPVKITPKAFLELGKIYCKSHKSNREIAYIGLIDEENLIFKNFLMGCLGSHGLCDWTDGNLLERAYSANKKTGLNLSLGHNHPRGYGAFCSDVKWGKREWLSISKKDDPVLTPILKSKIYQKHAADYCIMFTWAQIDPRFSKFNIIMSPRMGQVGIFEVRDKGRVIYHPWEVVI